MLRIGYITYLVCLFVFYIYPFINIKILQIVFKKKSSLIFEWVHIDLERKDNFLL